MNYMTGIALLIIDLQNAYFNNDALRTQQASLVENTNMIIEIARYHHLPVFNIRTEHQKDFATWTLNMLDDNQGYLFKGERDVTNINGLRADSTRNRIPSAQYGYDPVKRLYSE